MNWSGLVRGAAAIGALCCFGLPQADAMEILDGSCPHVHMNDGMVLKVVVVRHGGAYRGPHGGAYRHGTVYRGGAYRGGVYHGGVHGARYGAWARPGWYHWGPGGAIAAGAAIGVVGAVAAASWAGAAPGPGLCWYYTDPSRRQGFWDACP